jgi:peptide deformylase
LFAVAELVTDARIQVVPLLSEMAELMALRNGCGLAAPQVGVSLRFFIFREGAGVRVAVNPVIAYRSKEVDVGEEGCLSFPGQRVPVGRARAIRVRWVDETGRDFDQVLSGWMARVFQHECDHLDGVTILPRPSSGDKGSEQATWDERAASLE